MNKLKVMDRIFRHVLR